MVEPTHKGFGAGLQPLLAATDTTVCVCVCSIWSVDAMP